MAVQAQLYSDDQNMGLGLPFSLPLPLPMPICGSQDWLMGSVMGIDDDNGVCFQENPIQIPITNPQQTAQQQQQQQFHQVFQFLGPNNTVDNNNQAVAGPSSSSSSSSHNFLSMEFSQFLASELEKQRAEMDSYLQFQNERLSIVLREETRQRAVLLQRYASKLLSFIQQKEKDLAVANNRTMELQECLIKSDMESKAWKQKAIENEALVIDLTNKINQVREQICLISNGVPDSESICDSPMIKGNCKMCHVRSSCVLFFPCRHLCCCQSCEAVLGFCPVCESVKEASMEIFLV